jgi:hypothetical protein
MRKTLPLATLLFTLATSAPAFAGDTALAESLFREGRALMDKGDYAAACPKLSESYAQDAATGTLLALALCQEKAGLTASAWANFAAVAPRAKRDGRPEREQAAREHMAALEPKLSRLTIEVDAQTAALDGLVVKRDGQALGSGAWGAASPVDPGAHAIEVTAPGKVTWKGTVQVGANADAQTVKVPLLVDAPAQAASAPPPSNAASTSSASSSSGDSGKTLRTTGLIVGGAGLVGLGVSGIFGLRASSLNSESNEDGHCDSNNVCDSAGLEKRDDAVSAATTATVALIAGGVLTAAGVTLYLVGHSKRGRTETALLQATPLPSPGGGGLLLHGSF